MLEERDLKVKDIEDLTPAAVNESLQNEISAISEKCIKCRLCQRECAFLRKYGKPKDIADSYDPADKIYQGMPFECNLCQLCAAVCPVKINPAPMFLAMRRETVRLSMASYPEHSAILGYEKRGTSARYSHYAIPAGSTTVFFPGCTLPGTRPAITRRVYEYLQIKIPDIGIVLDCCTKPSHDLGRDNYFNQMFYEMKEYLLANGIRHVIVACPNCYKVFKTYGGELCVTSIYELMIRNGLPQAGKVKGTITVHDSCVLRFEEHIHTAIRNLITDKGLVIEEMPHHGTKTLCCGEGGSVGFLNPDFAKNWAHLRKNEAEHRRIIAYCAGCTNFLGSLAPTSHVLDLLFEPEKTLTGKTKVSKAPFTYLNRLKLKNYFKKSIQGAVTRERTFNADVASKKGGVLKRLLIILIMIAAILAIHFTGATRYLQQDELRELIDGYGALGPAMYMLFYTVAPALLLPGLPITIVGGILFGPFWGVVYTVISATAGACVAFLISRYVARGWVERKLTSPRWRQLDEGVERHGWKIVAFTRLIPLFPFNLLNYAFGLTKIKFLPYAATTLICILPACIAFIVFSSSLLDLLKGDMSPAFLIGFSLVILVSFMPFVYTRYLKKKNKTDPF
jgi:uncharacterized membrane protein YdjX (TVP38/TMEM64 family)/Fe-S oxidoreductase